MIPWVPGVWRQYDEQLILWTPYWVDGPTGGTIENCVGVTFSMDALAGKWWDNTCDTPHYYVCERDK